MEKQKICLLIHGYLTDPDDFQDLPEKITKFYDRIIKFVIPGHGEDGLKYFTADNVFKKVDEQMEELINPENQIDVIGFSLGGALAKYIACKYPINKVILLAPAVKHLSPKTIYRRFSYLLDKENKVDKKEIKKLVNEDIYATNFFFRNMGEKFSLKNYQEFRNILMRIAKFGGQINCPLQIIWGNFDELVPKNACYLCLDACVNPNKKLIVMPNIGHIMLRSIRKDTIEKLIINFME